MYDFKKRPRTNRCTHALTNEIAFNRHVARYYAYKW